jgi:hypothetical protein
MTTLSVLKRISALAATSVIAVTVTTAKASATTFYLGNGINLPEIKSSVSYTEDGISLLATGTQNSGVSRNIYQSTLGLGVTNSNSVIGSVLSGENQINGGITLGETLKLNFSHTVKLLSATFSRVGTNDSFKMLVDGNQYISADIPDGNLLDLDISKFTFTPSPTGKIFGFSVTDGNDDYLVKYVEVAKVPEPASMLGFLAFGAMGAGSMIKRKQQQKTMVEA